MSDIFKDDVEEGFGTDLVGWVMGKCNNWRDYYEANYSKRHDEYMRLFRNEDGPLRTWSGRQSGASLLPPHWLRQ